MWSTVCVSPCVGSKVWLVRHRLTGCAQTSAELLWCRPLPVQVSQWGPVLGGLVYGYVGGGYRGPHRPKDYGADFLPVQVGVGRNMQERHSGATSLPVE